MNDESYPENWVKLNLMVNTDTGEFHIVGGDREPCRHGYPPCCDTGYLGLEPFMERIKNGNV
jgi:hypothetical protein